jgi:hypothetical protein
MWACTLLTRRMGQIQVKHKSDVNAATHCQVLKVRYRFVNTRLYVAPTGMQQVKRASLTRCQVLRKIAGHPHPGVLSLLQAWPAVNRPCTPPSLPLQVTATTLEGVRLLIQAQK